MLTNRMVGQRERFFNFKHLGLIISFDSNLAATLTYNELIDKLNQRAKKVPFYRDANIFKRRNLCVAKKNRVRLPIWWSEHL